MGSSACGVGHSPGPDLGSVGHLGLKPTEWTLLEVTGPGGAAHPTSSQALVRWADRQSALLCRRLPDTRVQGNQKYLPLACPFNQSSFGGSDC